MASKSKSRSRSRSESKKSVKDDTRTKAGATATTKINRQDFGLKWGMVVEGTGVVADEVKIELDAEILRPLK